MIIFRERRFYANYLMEVRLCHLILNLSSFLSLAAICCSISTRLLIILFRLIIVQFVGLLICISSCIIFIFTRQRLGDLIVQKMSLQLFTVIVSFDCLVRKLLKMLQMFCASLQSQRRCFKVSVWSHLVHISDSVILYFFIFTPVKKSLWISLKQIFLSFELFIFFLNNVIYFLHHSWLFQVCVVHLILRFFSR